MHDHNTYRNIKVNVILCYDVLIRFECHPLAIFVNHLPPRWRSSFFFNTCFPSFWPRRTPKTLTFTLDSETAYRLVQASPTSFQRQDTSARCCRALKKRNSVILTNYFQNVWRLSPSLLHTIKTEKVYTQFWFSSLAKCSKCFTEFLLAILYLITSLLWRKEEGKEKESTVLSDRNFANISLVLFIIFLRSSRNHISKSINFPGPIYL